MALDSSARLGCFAAVVAAWDAGTYLLIHRLSGMFNDFDFYWASARLITRGRDPYDLVQMHQVLASIGLHPSSAMGYAYPLALAYLMVPLSFLPPLVAGLVFSGISLVALAAAATMLLAPLRGLWWVERLAIAFAIGSFVPITGSLRMGQINLLVLLLLVVAFRGLARASTLALAGAIKLSPVVGLFSFPPSQWWSRRGLLGGAAIFGIVTVLPSLVARGARLPVLGMLAPDAYYTNESVNGFVGRLGGAIWHTAPALLPRLPLEPTMLASVAVLAAVTVAVVLVNGWRSTDGVLALLLGFSVVAAPLNSLWNYTPLLITLIWCWPRVRGSPLQRTLIAAAWALIEVQQTIYDAGPQLEAGVPLRGLLGSTSLYGALLVIGVAAFLLVRERAAAGMFQGPGHANTASRFASGIGDHSS